MFFPIKHAKNRRFKSGDFDVENKERSGLRTFEDKELQALVNENPC